MIVVTGATGQLGAAVVERLLERMSADQVAVSVRDPQKVRGLADRGVQVRHGDSDEPDSLTRSFEGASRVLIVSLPRWGDKGVSAHRVAVDAAQRAGVQRVFYTSHVGADLLSAFEPAAVHARNEAYLVESGLPFTSLRNGFYPDTVVRWVHQARETGELLLPKDGPISWTTREDLAAATAALLADESLTRPVVNLTAAEAFDSAQISAFASELTGRRIRRVQVTDEDYKESLTDAGVPEFGAAVQLSMIVASRQRRLATVDPDLEDLIGHAPTALPQVLRDALA